MVHLYAINFSVHNTFSLEESLNVASKRDLEDSVYSRRLTSALYIGYNLAGHTRALSHNNNNGHAVGGVWARDYRLLLRLKGVVYCSGSCTAVSIGGVNDDITIEQNAFSKIHESKTL